MDKLAALIGAKKQDDHGLQERLAAIERQLGEVAKIGLQTPAPQSGSKDPDDVWPKRKGSNDVDIGEIVAAAVAGAMEPIKDELSVMKKSREGDLLVTQQQNSFNIAAQQYPDLKDPNSELSKVADQLFKSRGDLANLADAPMVISSMAKGILADARQVQAGVVDQKRKAAIEKPSGNLSVQALSDDRDRASQAKELKEKLLDQAQQEGINSEGFADLFRLNLEERMAPQE